jgi:hypothetical protein
MIAFFAVEASQSERKDLSADLRGIRAPTGFDGRASDPAVLRQKGTPHRVPFLLPGRDVGSSPRVR